uniref:F-box protein AT5G49610-like beta-propeller domain-containing protein n=1 Tax=Oryza barthii TaxID=65489 RepID=A0A0D3F3S6_9ORYZ
MDLSDPFDRGEGALAVISPLLHASRSLAVLPPVPLAARPPPVSAMGDDDTLLGRATDVRILLPEDGGDGQSYTVVTLEFFAKVSVLRAGAWDDDVVRATAPIELPARCRGDTTWNRVLLVQGKLYVLGMQSHAILVLDLASMAASFINLPDGVRHEQDGDLDLFRSNDAGLNLIHINGFQVRLWRRGGDDHDHDDGDGMAAGNWVLVDDIGVRRVFDHLTKVGGKMNIGGPVGVIKVGDDCDFMFLCVDGDVLYMDIRRKMVKKIFEASPKRGGVLPVIHPLTMVWWPPIFSVLE